jgi:hypothetical protein
MATGTLIAESIRVDATLDGVPFTTTQIRRVPADLSSGQRDNGLPDRWTLITFEVSDAEAGHLAGALAAILDTPGWYADLHTGERSFVVFAGRVLAYARGDARARAQAEAYARSHGVPDEQLDWP